MCVCIYIYIYPLPVRPPSHPYHPTSLGHYRAPKWVSCALYHVATSCLFTCGSIYVCVCVSILISQFVPPFLTHTTVSTCPLAMSVSLFLLCKWNHLYHFSRFHIYWLIYNILSYFTLWQILGLPTSISFLFMAEYCNTPLYTYTTLLYPFRCQGTFTDSVF